MVKNKSVQVNYMKKKINRDPGFLVEFGWWTNTVIRKGNNKLLKMCFLLLNLDKWFVDIYGKEWMISIEHCLVSDKSIFGIQRADNYKWIWKVCKKKKKSKQPDRLFGIFSFFFQLFFTFQRFLQSFLEKKLAFV